MRGGRVGRTAGIAAYGIEAGSGGEVIDEEGTCARGSGVGEERADERGGECGLHRGNERGMVDTIETSDGTVKAVDRVKVGLTSNGKISQKNG